VVMNLPDMDSGEVDLGQRSAVCSSWNILPPVCRPGHPGGAQGLHLRPTGRHDFAQGCHRASVL